VVRDHVDEAAFHLPEQLADVLAAIGFLLLGTALIGPILERATPVTFVYALASLTVIRMIPVGVAMLRSGFAPASIAYIGWFGPRGLASIVFAGAVFEAAVPDAGAITDVILLTVVLSLILHGVTAAVGARRYAAWFEAAAAADPEIPEAAELQTPGLTGRRRTHGLPR
jgi:NhaP-type Na+/H+ or K+/H+ antiporter